MYDVQILLDSVTKSHNHRLTTMVVTLPRIVLAEFNTHRDFSRNSASSRAIPINKIIEKVENDPFIPVYWGKNQKGMQAEEELSENLIADSKKVWLELRDEAVLTAKILLNIGVHKQITNRLLEPWMWQTIIVSSTKWDNFFNLRCDVNAQPEIRHAALMMVDAYSKSKPEVLSSGSQDVPWGWHLPLVSGTDLNLLYGEGFTLDQIKLISVGRCARVSYLTHFGKRDPQEDIRLAESLKTNGHMSPFEHVACAMDRPMNSGNFIGWNQFRKSLHNESVFQGGSHVR